MIPLTLRDEIARDLEKATFRELSKDAVLNMLKQMTDAQWVTILVGIQSRSPGHIGRTLFTLMQNEVRTRARAEANSMGLDGVLTQEEIDRWIRAKNLP